MITDRAYEPRGSNAASAGFVNVWTEYVGHDPFQEDIVVNINIKIRGRAKQFSRKKSH
jgi:hypothetical protein